MVRRILLICALQLLLWSCSDHQKPVQQTRTIVLSVHSGENSIVINNSSDVPLAFNLNLNDRFPLTAEILMSEVRGLADSLSVDTAEAAWMFVAENTFHSNSIAQEPWVHEPLLFLNSIGGGLCDDRNAVLAGIWQDLGFRSRVIGLEGHVVSEVDLNGDWAMYDADHGVFFLDSSGTHLSVEQVARTAAGNIIVKGTDSVNAFLWDFSRFRLAKQWKTYRSTNDNVESTGWYLNHGNRLSQIFKLPSYSSMKMVNAGAETVIKVVLTEKSTGELDVPLVAFATSGELEFERNLRLEKYNSDHRLEELPPSMIKVVNAANGAAIWYRVNPLLCNLKPINNLKLEVIEGEWPKIETQRVDSVFVDLNLRDALKVSKYLKESFRATSQIRKIDGMTNYQHLIDRLEALSLGEELSSGNEIDLGGQLNVMCDTLGISKEQLFNESITNYPMSLVMLNILVKYRMFDYAKSMYSGGRRVEKVRCRS